MAVTVDTLRDEVKASPSENGRLTRVLALANDLVDQYLLDGVPDDDERAEVPESVVDQAILVTATDLFHQSKAPNGVVNEQYDIGNGEIGSTPIRISRDPLRGARPVLAMWVGPVIA